MYNRYQGNTGRVLRVSDEPGSNAAGRTSLPGSGSAFDGASADSASARGPGTAASSAPSPPGTVSSNAASPDAAFSGTADTGAAQSFYAPSPRRSGPFFDPPRAQALESAPQRPGSSFHPGSASGTAKGPATGMTPGSAAGASGFIRPGWAAPRQAPRPVPGPPPGSIRPPGPLSGLSGELGRLLGRLSPMKLETDDLLLMMVLYLMYRESHDEELLFIMAAMFLL